MNASLVSIGTELMVGMIADTNAQFASQQLSAMGHTVLAHYALSDDLEDICRCLQQLKTPINIISGGLGPTFDDRTREAAAKTFQAPLEFKEELWESIQKRYPRLTELNRVQAFIPQNAHVLVNDVGTAPCFWIEVEGKSYFFLPGVPKEYKHLYQEKVAPILLQKYPITELIESRWLKVAGLPESEVAQKVIPILGEAQKLSGIFASEGVISLKLTEKGASLKEVQEKLDRLEQQIRPLFPKNLFGNGTQSLSETVVQLLQKNKQTVATAESCTGGLISAELTQVPGSSAVFLEGVVTYSNQAKQERLGVSSKTLEQFGAVSEETAKEMAEGLKKISGTTYTLSVTGIAGPGGGTPEKPVGHVCFGLSSPQETKTYTFQLYGNRDSVRKRATTMALLLLHNVLLKQPTSA